MIDDEKGELFIHGSYKPIVYQTMHKLQSDSTILLSALIG